MARPTPAAVAIEPGEARLTVQAAGLTRDQFTLLHGHRHGGPDIDPGLLPLRFGYEVAGVVDAVGPGVDASWVGRSVAPVGPYDDMRYGSMGEQAIVPAERLIDYSAHLTPVQAAAIWVPFLTAYGLIHAGQLSAGDVVVISAGSSAVGLAALQLARDAGATPILLTRSLTKAQQLRALGAEHVIVTSTEDYVARVAEISGGRGADITFDPIGGAFLAEAAAAARFGGTIIEYGVLEEASGRFPQELVIGKYLDPRLHGRHRHR